MNYVPLYFAPDIDNAWAGAPGALTSMTQFAPLQSGIYGTTGTSSVFALNGNANLFAKVFRQVNGAVRFLAFTTTGIDEYDSAGSRTNRLTSVAASVWDAAAWGNQIIAVDPGVATQSSTGGAFSGLGGSSPKARHIAANVNFVMMGDVDDGSTFVYSDAVWWSGLRNPATWTPSAATLAGRIRLLDAPGPLRALVAYRSQFVAFKDNAIFVGDFGGPYTFTWRLVSAKVGCIAKHSVTEIDGKLYWLHSSGFWEFDGQNLRNVGLPVFQSFLAENSYISGAGGRYSPTGGYTIFDVTKAQGAGDDIEGVVCFSSCAMNVSDNQLLLYYLYNTRSGKWGRYIHALGNNSGSFAPIMVKGSSADLQAFKADTTGRLWAVWNQPTNATFRSIRYPVATTDSDVAVFATGVYGDAKQASFDGEWFLRHMSGTDSLVAADVSGSVARYQNEDKITSQGTVSLTFNPEFNSLQGTADGKNKLLSVQYATSKNVLLGGMGPGAKASGQR